MNSILDPIIEKYQKDIISNTIKLIQIPSEKASAKPGMPFGTEIHNCLNTTLSLCQSLGFRTKNCGGYAGWAEIGAGPQMIGILVHLDIVPAGDGWSLDPFSGIRKNGRIYGRGAIDDKGPAIAAIYALKAIVESKIPLEKRIRIIFGTDEENTWECMDYYKAHEEMPSLGFSPDAMFPVIYAEKGILYLTLHGSFDSSPSCPYIQSMYGGKRANMVPDSCCAKIVIPDEITDDVSDFINACVRAPDITVIPERNLLSVQAMGIAAHGSTPEKGENAIARLMHILALLKTLNPSQKDFISAYNTCIGFETDGERLAGHIKDEPSGHLIVNPGLIEMDQHTAKLKINIRYPVTYTGKQIIDSINSRITDYSLKLTTDLNSEPLYISEQSDIVQTLLSVYREYTGDDSPPLVTGGGTYARSIDNAVAFGPVFPDQEELAHCPDEFISEEYLLLSAKIYAQALMRLANAGGNETCKK